MAIPTFTAGAVLTASQQNTLASYTSPTGSVTAFAGSTVPTNWLLCDGTAVSRDTYEELFTLIGTTYGVGDGSTTFNLPNLKGRVPVGFDSTQTEFDALGETGGAKTHTLTSAEMPAHRHDIQRNNVAASSTGADASTVYRSVADTGATYSSTQNTGGGGAHNNLQPYIVLNYIIKT
jgi:microcystin-dependent protein